MKFIGFWEYCAEDTEKCIEKLKQRTAMITEGTETERFPKSIFGPFHIGGECKGFTVYETDDMDKLANITVFYAPEMTWKFMPIQDSSKLAELWVKMKK